MSPPTHRARKSALDEFLPESALTSDLPLHLGPGEIELDAVETLRRTEAAARSGAVQMWPMLAAALIAIGVSLLALAAFARFSFTEL